MSAFYKSSKEGKNVQRQILLVFNFFSCIFYLNLKWHKPKCLVQIVFWHFV